jgi:AcrR family transcriptional regulator
MEQGDKREAVMQAAMELVGEHGFHGSPMALIAERAGVAAGTIYRFFDSKDTLIKEIYASLEGQILAAVSLGYPSGRPVRERFLHTGRQLVRYFLGSPLQFRFLEQYHNSPYGVASRRDKVFGRKKRNIIGELFEEAADQQTIKELPLPILFALTFGPLVDICRDHILKFITLDDALIERTVEACWDAVRR